MEKWLEDAKVRIKDFKKSHHLQRIQLELAFETAPRDSRYSNSLIDMMRKEEQIVAKEPNSPVTKSVIQKVDDSLRAETRGFFAKSVQKNVKKWLLVKEKFERETRQFTTGLTDEMRAYSNMKGPHAGMVRKNHTPTPEELDEEAERLEADYNLNWYKYENFSLQEAFKSQNNRIENDWATHEQTLEEEFSARREKIAGPGAFGKAVASPQAQATHDPRWQHPEKQKTLIHTAPVMSPSRANVGGSLDSQGWAKGKDNAAITAEVCMMYMFGMISPFSRIADTHVAGSVFDRNSGNCCILHRQSPITIVHLM